MSGDLCQAWLHGAPSTGVLRKLSWLSLLGSIKNQQPHPVLPWPTDVPGAHLHAAKHPAACKGGTSFHTGALGAGEAPVLQRTRQPLPRFSGPRPQEKPVLVSLRRGVQGRALSPATRQGLSLWFFAVVHARDQAWCLQTMERICKFCIIAFKCFCVNVLYLLLYVIYIFIYMNDFIMYA